jgi:alpha-methylacyl-CoA racemase
MSLKPLAGIRVLDFTNFPPGGYCTVMLADLGADVIRVEPPGQKGKPGRIIGQVTLARGKRSLTLDLRNPASVAILNRLVKTVDVVVESAKPGSMEARGFGYPQARALNPKVIWCAISGFGQEGPYADQPGHDLSYTAHSGLLGALTTDLPWHPGAVLAIPAGALMAVIGIQSALLTRATSGEGAFVDISMSESATWLLSGGINPLSEKPFLIPPSPDRRLYACADGRFIAVASAEPRTWAALCDVLDAPELKPNLHSAETAAATTEALARIFATRPAAEWIERLSPSGAAAVLVHNGKELLDDPQVRARGSIVESGGVPVPANPVRVSSPDGETTTTATDAPHTVGQDTVDVLTSAGFSSGEIDDLLTGGIV